ncbi:PREDICTED: uncharacterized protein LOC105447814 [Wasmannia auropunctata]|uniref:uncharacterized protein LOC105447814 n=1 Tax=Wasmannia auropunctata TaxID=64793 RepID=UPI0005ED69E0|nr:PREDICTED: uncharacterized protein LOC105447814 [Wasmannia auropunctata]
MKKSFTQWRDDSSSYRVEGDSVVISDSDEEDVAGSSREIDERVIIDESYELDSTNTIENSTPKRDKLSNDDDTPIVHRFRNSKRINRLDFSEDSEQTNDYEDNEEYHTISDFNNSDSDSYLSPIKNKGKKRKDLTRDNTREDIKELKPNSSSDSLMNFINIDDLHDQNNTDHKIADVENNKALLDVPVTIELDSDSTSGQNSDSEFAASFAKQEIGVGNIDPLIAQKRAIMVCKLEQLKNESVKMKVNMRSDYSRDICRLLVGYKLTFSLTLKSTLDSFCRLTVDFVLCGLFDSGVEFDIYPFISVDTFDALIDSLASCLFIGIIYISLFTDKAAVEVEEERILSGRGILLRHGSDSWSVQLATNQEARACAVDEKHQRHRHPGPRGKPTTQHTKIPQSSTDLMQEFKPINEKASI